MCGIEAVAELSQLIGDCLVAGETRSFKCWQKDAPSSCCALDQLSSTQGSYDLIKKEVGFP